MRGLTAIAAAAAWIYSWFLIRQVRNEFHVFRLGQVPLWLLILLGVTSTALLTTAVSIWLRTILWPVVSVIAGLLLFGSILGSQYAVMDAVYVSEFGSDPAGPGIVDAFNTMLERNPDGTPRGAVDLAVFVAAIPTLLVLSGISGMIVYRRLRPQEAANA